MKGVLELQQRAGNSLEFIENVKIDLFPDEVYVFTPKGRIMELPKGSTAVDFAYAVHTDVGNSCIACRINRRLAPLSEPLQSGQTVEIVTAPGARPNPAWLSFVVTGKARTHIRHALKLQRRSESINLGERLLNKTLTGFDSHLEKIPQERIQAVLAEYRMEVFEDLLEEIGLGNRMAYVVARRLLSSEGEEAPSAEGPLAIRGTEGLVLSYASAARRFPATRSSATCPPARAWWCTWKAARTSAKYATTRKMHPAQLGQGCHRRIQCRTARRAGAPAWPDRPARHQRQRGRRQHREDQHGRARRSHQRGPAGRQRARSRPPGPRHQEAARPRE